MAARPAVSAASAHGVPLAGEQGDEAAIGLRRRRVPGDQLAVFLLRRTGFALRGQEPGLHHAEGEILGPRGALRVEPGLGPGEVALRDMGLHQPGHGRRIAAAGERLQPGADFCARPLALQPGEVQPVGGGRVARFAQGLGDLAGARPVLAAQLQRAELGEQGRILGRGAQGVGEHPLGQVELAVFRQEAGVAQGFRRRPVRERDGEGQSFARQLPRALAQMRLGHDGHGLWVAGSLGQGGAHVLDGALGSVGGGGGPSPHLERGHLARIALEHGREQPVAAGGVAGRLEHPGELHLDLADGVRGRLALGQAAQGGDGLGLAALGEIQPGADPLIEQGIGGRSDQLVEFGGGGLGSFALVEELHEGERRGGVAGVAGDPGAQGGLGAGGVALGEQPAHLGPGHALVLRKELGHAGDLGPHSGLVPEPFQRGEPGEMEALVGRAGHKCGVGAGEGALCVLGVHPVGDQNHLGDDRARGLDDDALGQSDRAGLVAVAKVEGGLDCAHRRIRGRKLEGPARGGGGKIEVLDAQRQFGQFALRLDVVAVLVDERPVLAQRLLHVPLVAQQPGIGETGGAMGRVEAEDVAQLHGRPAGLALGEIGEGALVVLLGPLLLAVAGGERRGREQGEADQRGAGRAAERARGTGALGHRELRKRTRAASGTRPRARRGGLRHPIHMTGEENRDPQVW